MIDEGTTPTRHVTSSRNPFDRRESAERDALQLVTALLGDQTDRSHSRVRNWS